MPETTIIKVLVVDDSFVMRTLITDLLNADPEIQVVDTAKSGEELMNIIHKVKPDVITLDQVMPGMNGLETLQKIMTEHPTPVIILSAYTKRDAEITFQCLAAGAVSFVLKPSGELSLDIDQVRIQLLEQVKTAAGIHLETVSPFKPKPPRKPAQKSIGIFEKILVVGASTGGPQTLEAILGTLSVNFPSPIIVIQHMPGPFIESFALRLNRKCPLAVKVAEDGEVIQGGTVYFAPGGFSLTVATQEEEVIFHLEPVENGVASPLIDPVMKSVAQVFGANATGVILTGMGHDGLEGMKAIKESGGKTMAQDEGALVFGMPRVVIEANLADQVLSMDEIPTALEELVQI